MLAKAESIHKRSVDRGSLILSPQLNPLSLRLKTPVTRGGVIREILTYFIQPETISFDIF
jgi:hypothetical protein